MADTSADDSDDIVIPRQDEVRVFVNEALNVAIQQTLPDGERVVIDFDASFAERLCEAVMSAAKYIYESKQQG